MLDEAKETTSDSIYRNSVREIGILLYQPEWRSFYFTTSQFKRQTYKLLGPFSTRTPWEYFQLMSTTSSILCNLLKTDNFPCDKLKFISLNLRTSINDFFLLAYSTNKLIDTFCFTGLQSKIFNFRIFST